MFSSSENDYILALVNRYSLEGYKYYLVHSNVDLDSTNNVITFYFSKNEIEALSDDIFTIGDNSLKIDIVSNFLESDNLDVRSIEEYTGTIIVKDIDCIYTNAVVEYSLNSEIINPDIRVNAGTDTFNYNFAGVGLFMVVVLFCYIFLKSLLRIKK